jgi:hypothetical protein
MVGWSMLIGKLGNAGYGSFTTTMIDIGGD